MNAAGGMRRELILIGRLLGQRTGRLIRRYKVISSSIAVFVVAIIAVSLATSGSSAPKTDKTAASFTVPALGSATKKVSLTQYAGKPVIVNFFASWCEPCQQETPLLASWYKQEHGKVTLLGLDEEDPPAAAGLKFVAAKGVTYPVGYDPNATATSAYDVAALPQTFFLNAKHQIVYHVAGAVTQASLDKGLSLMGSAS